MRRIEDFCRNLYHDEDIEDQISGAQSSGIIASYRLTTLAAMNARRDANLCLWCDEIWYANHLHSCLYAPDYNCMFTCGKDFEVFAFVKVSKEGLKHMPVKNLQDRVHVSCADKVFDEMSDRTLSLNQNHSECLDYSNGVVCVENDSIVDKNGIGTLDDEYTPCQADEFISCANDIASASLTVPSFDLVSKESVCIANAKNIFDERSTPSMSSNDHYDGIIDNVPYVVPGFESETTQTAPTDSILMSSIAKVKPNVEGIGDNSQMDDKPHVQQVDGLENRRRMYAKLTCLDDSLFRDFIAMGANCERFSTFMSLLLTCRVSNKIPRDTSEHCGSIFQVKTKHFAVLPETVSRNFDKIVVLPLLTDMNWFVSPSFCMNFGIEFRNFKTFELENDWMAFLNFKELHSWGTYPSCLSSLLLTMSLENYIGRELFGKLRGVPDKCSLNTRIFDPGGRRWSVINVAGLRKSEMLGFVFDRGRHMVTSIISGTRILSFLCNGDEEIVSLFLCYGETSSLFDGLLFNKTVVMMFRVTVIDLVISGICVKAVIISHTLEDKGDFEAVGNSDVSLVKVDTYILNITRVRADSSSLCPPLIILSQRSAARTLAPQHIVSTSALRVPRDAACKIVVLLATSIVSARFPQVLVAPPLALATSFHWSSLVRSIDSGNKVGKYHLLVFETMPCLRFDIETLLNRLGEKQNEATVALCNSDLKGYIYDNSEVVMPKQDLLFCHGWLFNWININSVVYSTHVFDPGGKKLEGIQWDLDGVFNNGPFSVGIHGRNNMMTSFSNLLKENLRVAILSFGVLIVTYIFDPGGSLVNLFDRVIGIIACLIFDP